MFPAKRRERVIYESQRGSQPRAKESNFMLAAYEERGGGRQSALEVVIEPPGLRESSRLTAVRSRALLAAKD